MSFSLLISKNKIRKNYSKTFTQFINLIINNNKKVAANSKTNPLIRNRNSKHLPIIITAKTTARNSKTQNNNISVKIYQFKRKFT